MSSNSAHLDSFDSHSRKRCFVTIGLTASFNSLLSEILSQSFLLALRQAGYTDLVIQYGKEGKEVFDVFAESHPEDSDDRCGIMIRGFGFNPNGLNREIIGVRAGDFDGMAQKEGVVISHAGSGSILDALRMDVPLIVVPNPALLDNHQVELAEELAKQGYVIHGQLGNLAASLSQLQNLQKTRTGWPPVNHGEPPKTLGKVMDDEMGFVD